MAPETIDQFQGLWRPLNNFYPARVTLDGETYPTVEHGYQAAKTLDPYLRRKYQVPETIPEDVRDRMAEDGMAFAVTPGYAKRAGRHETLRPDWERVKVGVMLGLLRQKFTDPNLRELLLSTGTARLVEGNTWGDMYWGKVPPTGKDGPFCHGLNVLGMLLEQVRGEIRDERGELLPNTDITAWLAQELGKMLIGRAVRMERPKTAREVQAFGEPEIPEGMQALVVGVLCETYKTHALDSVRLLPRVIAYSDEGMGMTVHDNDQVLFEHWTWRIDGKLVSDPDTSIRSQR